MQRKEKTVETCEYCQELERMKYGGKKPSNVIDLEVGRMTRQIKANRKRSRQRGTH